MLFAQASLEQDEDLRLFPVLSGVPASTRVAHEVLDTLQLCLERKLR